jgi:hypothetical protein
MADKNLIWKEMTNDLKNMDEATIRAYLNHENSTHKRRSHLIRLHQRYVKLRDAREREEVLKGALL